MGWIEIFTQIGLVIQSGEVDQEAIEQVVRQFGGEFNLLFCGKNLEDRINDNFDELKQQDDIYVLHPLNGGYLGRIYDSSAIEMIENYDDDQHWHSSHLFRPISQEDMERMKQIAEKLNLSDKTVRVVTCTGRNGGELIFTTKVEIESK